MLNRIIKFSLDNRLIVLLLSVLILIGGTLTLLKTEVDIFPDLNAPTVTIMTEAPGLATEEVEQLVTYQIEVAVNGAQGVESVRSSSATGFSVVNVVFNDRTDPLVARQTISERLSQLEGILPPAANTPVIGPQSSILGEILIIGLTSDSLDLKQIRTIADRRLRPALQGISGVSSVSVIGGDEAEYRITLDQGLMKHYGVTLQEVSEALADMNSNSAGSILNSYGNEYAVKGDLSTMSIEEIGQAVIRSDGNGIVTVADIATVSIEATQPKLGSASVKTRPSVIMTVTKQPGVGTISLTEKLLSELDIQRRSLPESLEIDTDIFSQRDFIDNSIDNLSNSLFEGALMVIIVLFFFMMNVRATAVSLIALPMSIIITVLIMHFSGMTINTMSLGGIAIAIGSLVDDAIVDVENVTKRIKENRLLPADRRLNPLKVIFKASAEVRMPIFNSSLIIVAGFMPLFFLSGVEGRMLVPLGIAFIISLAASTIVALTLTPVVCSYILPKNKKEEAKEDRDPWLMRKMKSAYLTSLNSAFAHKKVLTGIVGTLFIAAIIIFFNLGHGFLPSFNEGSFTINVSAMPGISLEESDKLGRMAEEIILSVPEIKTTGRKTGRAELDEHSLGTNVSEIEAPYTLSGRSKAEVASELREKLAVLPGVNIEIGQPISHRIDAMLSGTEAPVVIKIYGDDLDKLNRLAGQVKAIMQQVEGLEDIAIEQQIDRPEISIIPRRHLLAAHGITASQFNDLVNTALAGKIVSQVFEDGYPRNLTLKISLPESNAVDELASITVDTSDGPISLSDIAEIRSTTGPNTINRDNNSRRITVSANIEGRDVSSAVNEMMDKIDAEIKLPEGYSIIEAGQAQSAAAASQRLLLASIVAILIIFALLYYEFKSLKQSLIILINMPLAMIGGIIIIWICGLSMDIPAIIGMIALLGIATRNGMLLISHYNDLIMKGISVKDAVIKGSIDRIAPIVMTALTSALALIPLALRGGDPGNEIQSPLAIVILGGLATSTLLNLFITPIIFLLTNSKNKHK